MTTAASIGSNGPFASAKASGGRSPATSANETKSQENIAPMMPMRTQRETRRSPPHAPSVYTAA